MDAYSTANCVLSFAASNLPGASSTDPHSIVVGNGKLGAFPSYSGFKATRIVAASKAVPDRALDVFNPTGVSFFVPDAAFSANGTDLGLRLSRQQLNMQFGVFTSTFDCFLGASNMNLQIESDLYAVRQIPTGLMQTFRIANNSSNALPLLGLRHTVSLSNANVATSAFSLGAPGYDGTLKVLGAAGVDASCGQTISSASAYVPATYMATTPNNATPMAFTLCNVGMSSDAGAGTATATFQVVGSSAGSCELQQQSLYRLHIASAVAVSDSSSAAQSTMSLMLSQSARGSASLNNTIENDSMNKIRTDHVAAWSKSWATSVSIAPTEAVKTSAAAADPTAVVDLAFIANLNRALQIAFYNVISCTPAATPALGFDAASDASVLDLNGTLSTGGDLWLAPLLALFAPQAARSALESRYDALQSAVGDGEQVRMFEVALVAISAWNYFRVTSDRAWLSARGYAIMSGAASYIAGSVTWGSAMNCKLLGVVCLDGTTRNDDSLTNYLARLALKHTIEASYELGMTVRPGWMDLCFDLPLQLDIFQGAYEISTKSAYDVLRIDGDTLNAQDPPVTVLETLVPLLPCYDHTWFKTDGKKPSSVINNLNNTAAMGSATHPYNLLMRAVLYARAAQVDPTNAKVPQSAVKATWLDLFSDALATAIGAGNMSAVWGNLRTPAAADSMGYNDLSCSALLLLAVCMGACGARIAGGVAETRFYYERFGLQTDAAALLPPSWKSVALQGLSQAGSFQTVNAQAFTRQP